MWDRHIIPVHPIKHNPGTLVRTVRKEKLLSSGAAKLRECSPQLLGPLLGDNVPENEADSEETAGKSWRKRKQDRVLRVWV